MTSNSAISLEEKTLTFEKRPHHLQLRFLRPRIQPFPALRKKETICFISLPYPNLHLNKANHWFPAVSRRVSNWIHLHFWTNFEWNGKCPILQQHTRFTWSTIATYIHPHTQSLLRLTWKSGSKWMSTCGKFSLEISSITLLIKLGTPICSTHSSIPHCCFTSSYFYCFQNQLNWSCNRTLKSCLFHQLCPVSKDFRFKIIITLSSETKTKQSTTYQSSSSTLAACRQRLAIVLIITTSPAET